MTSSTHEFVKCHQCLGVKSYMGLGMIMKDCHVCDQVGYIKKPIDDIETLAAKQNNVLRETSDQQDENQLLRPVEIKKRGRKKKVI